MGILIIEILIIFSIAALYFFTDKKTPLLEKIINTALIMQTIAMPIIFTSITRSVFEVSKLLTMRLVLITVTATWLIQLILNTKNQYLFNEEKTIENQKIFSFFKLKWLATGIEWPLLAWIIVNLLSTFLSPVWPISVIGAYDRWEGIYLVLNYVLLLWIFTKFPIKTKIISWLLWCMTSAAFLSSVYGIFQSTGRDFMRWSVDPTARVFASINNPVHFSAYVAMLIPLCIGWLLATISQKNEDFDLKTTYFAVKKAIFEYISSKFKNLSIAPEIKRNLLIILMLFFIPIMQYTANLLSYGRATWTGTVIALAVVFALFTNILNSKSQKLLFFDFMAYIAGIALWYFFIVFKVQYLQPRLFWPIIISLAAVFIFNAVTTKNIKSYVLKFFTIIGIGNLQFISSDFKATVWFLIFFFLFFKFSKKMDLKKDIRRFSIIALLLLWLAIFVPSLNLIWKVETENFITYIQTIKNLSKDRKSSITATNNITSDSFYEKYLEAYSDAKKMLQEKDISKTELNVLLKSQGYTGALHGEGSARLSMWKSGLVWARDYPVFGTGPGTIKEMYPKYRRADYGRLEGGQNFTPDKLHNEYINVMATNGFLGFAVYFLWFLPVFLWVLLKRIQQNYLSNSPSNYLIIGLLGGCFVYWGQTLFNFGVVATKSLAYMLMGLALAITIHNPWKDFTDTKKD